MNVLIGFQTIRNMILIICAVGGVVIDDKVGKPVIKKAEKNFHLRRVAFHKITIQVVI